MSKGQQKRNTDQVVSQFRTKHGDYYDYSKVEFVNSHQKVTIICPKHGAFEQTPAIHLRGSECKECGNAKRGSKRRDSTESFIEKARAVHGNRYDYTPTVYGTSRTQLTINCHIHGAFEMLPGNHLRGSGCRLCVTSSAKLQVPSRVIDELQAETDIGDYIESLGLPVIRNTRKLVAPKEIDIYVEEKGLAIEYCGLYWHGERGGKDSLYHRDKQLTLGDQGIELVTVFEDEWLDRSDVVKSILRAKLGLAEFGPGARHLRLEPITHAVSAEFLNLHHIQGAATGSLHLGAWHNGVLVGVMVFGEPTRQTSLYQWELKRFSTDGRIYSGMMSKMFNWFVKEMGPESVVSFSDNRWFAGGSYQKIGFTKDAEIPPDYYYTRGGLRYHKSRFRKSGIKRMHPEFYDDALTERVMMEQIGYDRVWDCGKIRWVWTPI